MPRPFPYPASLQLELTDPRIWVRTGQLSQRGLPQRGSLAAQRDSTGPDLAGPGLAGPEPEERFTLSGLGEAVRKVTPTLLVVGIATGMAFAIGSGLGSAFVNRYISTGRK